jgi:hypothetical protein
MAAVNAADLPEGTVVVDDDRHLAWFAFGKSEATAERWLVTGSGKYITDESVSAALLYTARVLRFGY